MLGAIIGDIIGSRFEKDNIKTTEFELFTPESRFTDDTVLTIAIADSVLNNIDYKQNVKKYGNEYPDAGYGGMFKGWLAASISEPYNSWGNGSAMRASPIGFGFNDAKKVLEEAKKSAAITHNHPEGIKGAQAIALAVFLARKGASKEIIKGKIQNQLGYNLDRTLDEIRPDYKFDVSCRGSVPESIIAFLESENFEDSIRLAISIGGDSDTIASMTGAISEAFYKDIPEEIAIHAKKRLPEKFIFILEEFQEKYSG